MQDLQPLRSLKKIERDDVGHGDGKTERLNQDSKGLGQRGEHADAPNGEKDAERVDREY